MRAALAGILAAVLSAGAVQGQPAEGDEKLLSITVEGDLSPETEEALRRLLTEAAPVVQAERETRVEAARLRQAARAAAFETAAEVRRAREIEGQAEVLRNRAEALSSAAPVHPLPPASGLIRRMFELEREQPVIARRVAEAQRRVVTTTMEAVAREEQAARLEGEARQVTMQAAAVASGVAQDVAHLGFSRRQLVLPANPTPEQQEAIAILARDPAVSAEIEPDVFDSLHVEFVHPVEDVQTETTGAGEACTGEEPGWPFDAERVAAILRFNGAVWDALGLPAPSRSRLVVVDTGFDRALVENAALRRTLWADPSELLYARREIRSNQLQWRCVDRNRTNYYADVYGIGFDEGREVLCQSGDYHERQIAPIERRENSAQVYWPDHGGFVAGLAVGGPDFLEAFPEVARFIGLTIVRTTREPSAFEPQSAVMVGETTLGEAFAYASDIGADVINFSMKTESANPFRTVGDGTVLVTSAGNRNEALDNPATNRNMPAALASPRFELIVVGGLMRDGDQVVPWPQSAHSSSKVHIAAPAVGLRSYDRTGALVCESGTSGASALVSFVAATLKALGTSNPRHITERILAAADVDPALENRVRGGRVLNVPATLDVFVDQLTLREADGSLRHRRGYLMLPDDDPRLVLEARQGACLAGWRGMIDPSLVWDIRVVASADGEPSAMVTSNRQDSDSFSTESCGPLGDGFRFFDVEAGEEVDVSWADVERLLPTPVRGIEAGVREFCGREDCRLDAFVPGVLEDDDE